MKRTASRATVMRVLEEDFGIPFVRRSEDFDGRKGAIWTTGEDAPHGKFDDADIRQFQWFDYSTPDPNESVWIAGVRRDVFAYLLKVGWFAEWYDGGTVFIYKNS